MRIRVAVVAGTLVVLLLAGFVIWSLAFKVWCIRHVAWGEQVYGEELGKCVREKSLFDF